MISGGPVCILVHPDKLFIQGPFFWGLCPIAIDVISMETKPYLVEYWLQLKTETEHPDSNPEVHVYVHKACAKGIKTCARRNNIVGIICNWIFPDHPDLRETALFRGYMRCEACLLRFWNPDVLRFQGFGDVQHSWLNVFWAGIKERWSSSQIKTDCFN